MSKDALFSIIYKDTSIAVLSKRAGLLVASDRWNPDAPRLDLAAASICERDERLFAVHRIDRETSGLVVYALNSEAHKKLCAEFENRRVKKTYHALIYGSPEWENTSVSEPLRADGDRAHRTIPDRRRGKKALTLFRNFGRCGAYSWIEAQPLTGRTHQIRAHLRVLGFSIVCDSLYGRDKPLYLSDFKSSWRGDKFEEKPLISRLALHAFKIAFAHPETGKCVEFTAPYPRDLNAARSQLAKRYGVDPLNPVNPASAEPHASFAGAAARFGIPSAFAQD